MESVEHYGDFLQKTSERVEEAYEGRSPSSTPVIYVREAGVDKDEALRGGSLLSGESVAGQHVC